MIKKRKPAFLLLLLLMIAQNGYAQTSVNIQDYISRKFRTYVSSVPREEIYIHSDREEYISGEDMWFNIYLIDRQSMKPSAKSSIAYFEILNPENRPVVQRKVFIRDGFGPGQIVLPDTLTTGTYTVRAYTNWMRNFLPVNCFSKTIHIYNGFSNKVFKGRKHNFDSKDDRFNNSNGIILKTDNFKPDVLELEILADETYREENNNLFCLFIQTHGIINHLSLIRVTGASTRLLVPKQQLSEGINQITLFSTAGKPVAERLIYTAAKTHDHSGITVADSTKIRNKITIDLDYGQSNIGNLSISVRPPGMRQYVPDMHEYMIFGSEFGLNPGDVFRKKGIDKMTPQEIDSLLLTVKSNWIVWSNVLADELPVPRFRNEYDHHYISGRLLTQTGKETIPNRFVILSSPGKIPVFQYAETDTNGNFTFNIHVDNKLNDLIIQPDLLTKNAFISIESPFSDQYLPADGPIDSALTTPGYISDWSVNQQVRKIYKVSAVGEPVEPKIQQPVIKRFYGRPDTELKMKDYIALPVMEEVFFELLAGVSLKNKKTGYEISMSDPNNFKKPYDLPPGLFIDGVMIKDAGIVAKLEPELIEKIDVVREKYFVGSYQFFGVVNLITKTGDFSIPALPDDAIRFSNTVIDPVYSFTAPDYSSAEMTKNRIPDFRNTLYWNPGLRTRSDGKTKIEFWASDFISDYVVTVQGITEDGRIITLNKRMKIKR